MSCPPPERKYKQSIADISWSVSYTHLEVGKGTGLGLATVHSIVKNHGAIMFLESEVGKGTTFKIYLPASPSNRAAVTVDPVTIDLPRGHGELVLVIDDEISIREITHQTLEAFGYRVVTASDGAHAVVLYAKQASQIALVLVCLLYTSRCV